MTEAYKLEQFVGALREATSRTAEAHALMHQLEPLVLRLAASEDLRTRIVRECDPVQGFGFQLLHEEADHTLCVAVLSWLPGRGTPAHDHGTWGVVAGVEGAEINTFWRRTDDRTRAGHAVLEKDTEVALAAGQAVLMGPEAIHSVRNDTRSVSVSLHVYGKHINHTERWQYDTGRDTVAPWKVTERWQAHPSDRRGARR